jgi:hypothetical protein
MRKLYLFELKRIVVVQTIERQPLLLNDAIESTAALRLSNAATS